MCCVSPAGPQGRCSTTSPLLSPVGFDSFDVAHQVLSETDTKNLKKKKKETTEGVRSSECSEYSMVQLKKGAGYCMAGCRVFLMLSVVTTRWQ